MHHIHHALSRQLHVNRDKNLLSTDAQAALEIDPVFLAALEEVIGIQDSGRGFDLVDELIRTAMDSLIGRIYAINQFVQVSPSQKDRLEQIYRHTWDLVLKRRQTELVLRRSHYPRIGRWVAALYPETLRGPLASVRRLGQVPCQEYSALFQLELYGLDPASIREPLLDIGCGQNALLVRHLRKLGVESYGLDRAFSVRAPYLLEGDWLLPVEGPSRWGTIVSNMAFTNHFRFVARYDQARKPHYVQRYGEILDSLEPGGVLLYGPGAPELERAVDGSRFTVETRKVLGDDRIMAVRRLAPQRR